MKIRLIFTLIVSKLLIKLLRLMNRGGTTFPGKVALKIYPELSENLASRFKIIMVTGTNGKTTTSRIIGQALKEHNLSFIENKSGANLLSGITTTLIESVSVTGRNYSDIALLEIDEAAFKQVSSFIRPYILVVTNFFKDQLDRFGELNRILDGVASGIAKNPETKLILNADDSLCASLGVDCKNEVLYYGIEPGALKSKEHITNTDAVFCVFCKSRYEYDTRFYAHLGWYRCTSCGYRHPDLDVSLSETLDLTSDYSRIKITFPDPKTTGEKITRETKINLPGIYNIYNGLAAYACTQVLGLPADKSLNALSSFKSGFGRMESFSAQEVECKMILVKNPTGFNQVIDYLFDEEDDFIISFLINDNSGDGADISWLWDVEFERLLSLNEKIKGIYTSGKRAEDMAVRLKYAGFDTSSIMQYPDTAPAEITPSGTISEAGQKMACARIKIEKDFDMLLDMLINKNLLKTKVYILPTYTAMMDLRKKLVTKYDLPDFWE